MPRLLYIFSTAYISHFFQRGQNDFLKQHGYEIHVAASDDRYLWSVAERDGMTPHPIAIRRSPAPFRDLAALVKLIKLIHTVQPDLICAGTPKGALLGMLASLPFRKPVRLFACHGTIAASQKGIRRYFYRFCETVTARIADQVWCVSHSLLDHLRQKGILSADKGLVLGNGTANGVKREWIYNNDAPLPAWIAEFRAEKEKGKFPVVGFVGRLATVKGIDILGEAWRILRVKHPEVRLLVIGEWDPVHAPDEKYKKMLMEDPRVLLPGFVDNEVLGFCYDLMDVFVLPSRGEGFGTVTLEASLAGLPVVITNVRGCVDAIRDEVHGKLIPPENAEALAEAALFYLRHPEVAERHGSAGQARAIRDFDPIILWNGIYDFYSHLLALRKR